MVPPEDTKNFAVSTRIIPVKTATYGGEEDGVSPAGTL